MDGEKLKAKVQTVLGLVDAEKLGITLTHEHFLIDMTALVYIPKTPSEKALAYQPVTIENLSWVRYNMYSNLDNNRLLDEELAIKEAMLFKKAGGKTIVDVTNGNIGRDPVALVRISQATGLNVIMGSGYYVGEVQSRDFDNKLEEEITEEIVRDITVGVNNTGIRSGIIGEIGCSWPLQDRERKTLRASARAQQRTGAAITIHTGHSNGLKEPLMEIIGVLDRAGADIGRVIMGHLDCEVYPLEVILELAKTGCYLQYDRWGDTVLRPVYLGIYDKPSDIQRLHQIMGLIDKGHLNQILMSQDVCIKTEMVAYGGYGCHHILRNVVPQMLARGISSDEIDTILIDNPKRLLQF